MKSFSSYIKFGIPGIIVGILISTGVQFVFSWSGPTQAPPNGNTDTPLNVSAVDQTKAGSLTLGVSVLSPIFFDSNNTGYYVDPNGTSQLNYGIYNNLYSNGWMQAPIFYDANNTGYYVDPTGMSYLTNSSNVGYINTTSNNWGLLTYGAGFNVNSDPQNPVGSIYTNDIYLRSIGMWASQLSGGGGGGSGGGGGGGSVTVSGGAPCPANSIPTGSGAPATWVGPALHGQMWEEGVKGMFYCFNGTVTFVRPNESGAGGGGGTGSGGGGE